MRKGWTKATGTSVPDDPSRLDVSTSHAVTWVIISSIALSVVRLTVRRAVGKQWAKATNQSAAELADIGL
jgi:Protein of unknown function (DUF4235)